MKNDQQRNGIAALEARGLVKRFGEAVVVDGIDLTCGAGSVLGLLGPNGAGKTTTLRMLYGFLAPDEGTIAYFGRDFSAYREESKREIGVCTQDDSLDYDFSVEQNLRVYASYFRPRVERLDERIEELLSLFELGPFRESSPHVLSGGFKRRLLIARSIVHRPRILFLDEPTTGLDPKARVALWSVVSGLREEGMAIVLTTHYMDEAQRLSDELLVLARGRTVARGSTRRVIGEMLGEQVLVMPTGGGDREGVLAMLREEVGVEPHLVLDEVHAPLSAEDFARVHSRFPSAGLRLRDPTLDDLFLRLEEPR